MHHMDGKIVHGEKTKWKLHKNAECCLEQILEATPHKKAVVCPLAFYLANHQSKMNKICGILLEKQGWVHKFLENNINNIV